MASVKNYIHPDLEDVTLTAALQALGDPCRVAIVLMMLKRGEEEIACNEVPVELSKATISHHFETLREAGVIFTRVEGRKCLSSVRRKEFDKRFPGLLKLVLNAD
jgi:DNA-binding transcriptional ArsR family regulator